MSKDAQYVEAWLLQDENNGGIIDLFDKFRKCHGWETKRMNIAFHEVFFKSNKVGW